MSAKIFRVCLSFGLLFFVFAQTFIPAHANPVSPDVDIIIDDGDSGFDDTDGWNPATNWTDCQGYGGDARWTHSRIPPNKDDVDHATWTPNLPQEGDYQVYVHIPRFYNNLADTRNARYIIHYSGGSNTVVISQEGNWCQWIHLGTYRFAAGVSGYVYLGDYTGESPQRGVIADAMRFVLINPTYSIAGRVTDNSGNPVANTTLTAGGYTAYSDSSGYYSLSGLGAGTHTVTPAKSGYNFSPSSRSVSLPPAATAQNFVGSQGPTYQVTGIVTNGLNIGIDSVQVSIGGLQATTNNNGQYTISGLPNGTYQTGFSKSGYTFSHYPPSISIQNSNLTMNAIGHYTSPNVDSGFRPNPNGFSFPNKGYAYSDTPASWLLFKRTFPAAVMENSDGSRKQAAETFFRNLFLDAGRGGHCRGFSHASLVYYGGLKTLETTEDDGLLAPNNTANPPYNMVWRTDAMDYLHIYQARWFTSTASKGRIYGQPSFISQLTKDALADFRDNALDIAIFFNQSGHSLVPYRVERIGNIDRVFVYDNNFPGNTQKYIDIDTGGNTWKYNMWGSVYWTGSNGSIYIDLARNQFPGAIDLSVTSFSGPSLLSNDPQIEDIIVSGDVMPLFIDGNSRRLGIVGETFYNEIPGASIDFLPMNDPSSSSIIVYHLPNTIDYQIQVYSPNGGTYDLMAYGSEMVTELRDVPITAGTTDMVKLQDNLHKTRLASGGGEDKNYCYFFANDDLVDASRSFNLCTMTSSNGEATFSVATNQESFSYINNGRLADYVLTISQTGQFNGSQVISGNVQDHGLLMIASVPGSGPGGKDWVAGNYILFLPTIKR